MKFFHRTMVHHRHINRITHLEDEQGNLIKEHTQIEAELNRYYHDLLTETKADREATINRVTSHIPSMVTLEENATLMRHIMQEEVDQATKYIPPGKSPGPDGFTTDFFHHC